MKLHSLSPILAVLTLASACISEDPADSSGAQDELQAQPLETGSAEQAAAAAPLAATWYYTCSNELLACRAGYGAVEWIRNYPACLPKLYRVKCQLGAVDP